VAGEQGVDDLRDDRVFVAVNAGEQWLILFDHAQEVLAHFGLHGARDGPSVEVRDAFELTKSARSRMSCGFERCGCRHEAPFRVLSKLGRKQCEFNPS